MRIRILHACMLLCMCFSVIELAAQTLQVRGRVTSAVDQEPLAGVTVTVQGRNMATSTDQSGQYALEITGDRATLVFTQMGMLSSQLVVTQTGVYDIQLQEGMDELEEVIVVGYGTQRKGDLTAPIATVDMEEMGKRTVSNPMEALQGAVTGVQIVNSGTPGTTPTVRIRGVGSFNNESPLYVVDGMFMDNIDFLNPNDIAEMSVLKDASGAAIYGVRAANGVILVTTKKGTLNMKPRVTYNGYVGFQSPTNVLRMANAREHAAYAIATGNETFVNNSVTKFGSTAENPAMDTDWYQELLRSRALLTNHNLDIQGGAEKITYTFGVNYLDQDGIMDAKNSHRKYNIRMQTEAHVTDWLKLGFTAHFNNFHNYSPDNAAFRQAYFASPLYPVYDPSLELAKPEKFGS